MNPVGLVEPGHAGHALGVLPAQTAKQYARLGLLAELNVSLKDILGPVALVTRRNHARSPAAESFLSLLRGVAQELHRNSKEIE